MLILAIPLIIILLSAIAYAQPTNDTWGGNNWGGDTDENTYSDPLPPPEEEQKSTSICGSVIVATIPIGLFIFMRKQP